MGANEIPADDAFEFRGAAERTAKSAATSTAATADERTCLGEGVLVDVDLDVDGAVAGNRVDRGLGLRGAVYRDFDGGLLVLGRRLDLFLRLAGVGTDVDGDLLAGQFPVDDLLPPASGFADVVISPARSTVTGACW